MLVGVSRGRRPYGGPWPLGYCSALCREGVPQGWVHWSAIQGPSSPHTLSFLTWPFEVQGFQGAGPREGSIGKPMQGPDNGSGQLR